MRIIAGTLKGRTFDSPHSTKTHPMSDKIRGALFNILGDIEDLTILDAFAGTGAISFDAISRGAASATAIEIDKAAQKTITANIFQLGLQDKVKLISASASAWATTSPDDQLFNIVFCDPPYGDVQVPTLQKLASKVETEGLLILSWPPALETPAFINFTEIERRTHGDAQLIFYRR